MEPLLDVLDIAAVSGATWDKAAQSNITDRVSKPNRNASSPTFVVNLPKNFTAREVAELTRDFKLDLATDQPWIILDLSEVKEMDTAGLDLLVHWLEETLRRDGTVSLRGISPEAATILELTGVDRVLSMFAECSMFTAGPKIWGHECAHIGAACDPRSSSQVSVGLQ
jgi:anti-anti-sigma factor